MISHTTFAREDWGPEIEAHGTPDERIRRCVIAACERLCSMVGLGPMAFQCHVSFATFAYIETFAGSLFRAFGPENEPGVIVGTVAGQRVTITPRPHNGWIEVYADPSGIPLARVVDRA